MKQHHAITHEAMLRASRLWTGALLCVTLALGTLHIQFSNIQAGKIYWFHLDKERNLPTWFSGTLFLLFGCAALLALYWETRRNAGGKNYFCFPQLWLVIAAAGAAMSLDEITILHENLFWKEVRVVSSEMGGPWTHLAQWQLVFAPFLLVMFLFFLVFFINRFSVSTVARRWAIGGLGCWTASLLLESVRSSFLAGGKHLYGIQVVLEEELEMAGAIFLLAAIVRYSIDIAFDFTEERRIRQVRSTLFMPGRTFRIVAVLMLLLGGGSALSFLLASRIAASGTPLPGLFRKALQSTDEVPGAIWFDDIRSQADISDKQCMAIAEAVLDGLETGFSIEESLKADIDAVSDDRDPQIVFLTAGQDAARSNVFMGTGHGLQEAVLSAFGQAVRNQNGSTAVTALKFDIVESVERLEWSGSIATPPFSRGVEGIAYPESTGIAFLPGEVLAKTLLNSKGKLVRKNIRKSSDQVGRSLESRNGMFRFKVRSFFTDGRESWPVFGGHRVYQSLSSSQALTMATAGGRYLSRSIGPDGRFVYSWLPKAGREKDDYNILRHAGTIYAMLELYEIDGGQDLLQGIRHGLTYLSEQAVPCGQQPKVTSCIVENGYVKLGANALAIIAMTRYEKVTKDTTWKPLVERLGRWILETQESSGRFAVHKMEIDAGQVFPFRSEYYSGEALLALLRLHAADPRIEWLHAATRSANYLVKEQSEGVRTVDAIHDHWLMYGLDELYRLQPDERYLVHMRRLAESITGSQNMTEGRGDWYGSYYKPPRSTPTATRTEGLCAAWRILDRLGNRAEADSLLPAIEAGITFQLQTWFGPESVLYLDDPARSLGGFHRSLTDYEIRIDYVQHNISAILAWHQIRQNREQPQLVAIPSRFERHGEYDRVHQEVQSRIVPAVSKVSECLGVPFTPLDIRLHLLARKEMKGSGEEEWARTMHGSGSEAAIIELRVEPLLSGAADPAALLEHEMTHAALHRHLGVDYRNLPEWLREGLAVYVAGETREKIRQALAWSEVESMELLANGLDDNDHRWTDYGEDGAAIEFLVKQVGPDAVPRLVELLRSGIGWEQAVQGLTRLPVEEFKQQASDFCREQFRKEAGDDGPNYAEGLRLFKEKRYAEANDLLEETAGLVTSPYATPAMYYAGRSHAALGDHNRAESFFSHILDERRKATVNLPAVLYHSARSAQLASNHDLLSRRCGELMILDPGRRRNQKICGLP